VGNLVLNSQTVLTQTGTNTPEIANPVLNKSLTSLDTSASNGATSNADNTALPLFGCRAFVRFDSVYTATVSVNGVNEEHCTIASSGNISKVVRTGTGDYKIHFAVQMPDTNYAAVASTSYGNTVTESVIQFAQNEFTETTCRLVTGYSHTSPGKANQFQISVVIFR
tara:strand:+ start:766 stop:1266 length:501 start_codon:yes stop_codon:yes gene_type:complete